jgi:hypothetical protein
VALTQRPAKSHPPERFGMTGVTFFIVFNNRNNRVQFAVFTQKALPV